MHSHTPTQRWMHIYTGRHSHRQACTHTDAYIHTYIHTHIHSQTQTHLLFSTVSHPVPPPPWHHLLSGQHQRRHAPPSPLSPDSLSDSFSLAPCCYEPESSPSKLQLLVSLHPQHHCSVQICSLVTHRCLDWNHHVLFWELACLCRMPLRL